MQKVGMNQGLTALLLLKADITNYADTMNIDIFTGLKCLD